MDGDGNPFEAWLKLQLKLQREWFVDPRILNPEERATFLIWNAFAAEDEIHEAMKEVGWKPWAKSRHMNDSAFIEEMVDALHFVGNMILSAAEDYGESAESLAAKVWGAYQNKVQVNIQRQIDEYKGIDGK